MTTNQELKDGAAIREIDPLVDPVHADDQYLAAGNQSLEDDLSLESDQALVRNSRFLLVQFSMLALTVTHQKFSLTFFLLLAG